MFAFDPAVMHELTLLVTAIAVLIKAIWPNAVLRLRSETKAGAAR
jgi:hypothetical protein